MKARIARLAAVACAVLLASCGGGAAEAPQTNDTTARLLEAGVGDGMSTPLTPPDLGAGPQAPPVKVSELGFNRGDTASYVKVVELSDFGCGYCRRFHEETFPVLLDEFIGTGKVEWKFIPFITGMFANSLAATEAGECVMEQSPAQYETLAGRIWAQQGDWKNASEPETVLRGWVGELRDLDMGAFDSCLSENRRMNRIAQATTLAQQVGVRGTPTFLILGYGPLQGALPTDFFQQVLNAVHAEEVRQREGAPEGDTGN